jgi:hypothetical protein
VLVGPGRSMMSTKRSVNKLCLQVAGECELAESSHALSTIIGSRIQMVHHPVGLSLLPDPNLGLLHRYFRRSGKEILVDAIHCLKPSTPAACPGIGLWSTTSGATKRSSA